MSSAGESVHLFRLVLVFTHRLCGKKQISMYWPKYPIEDNALAIHLHNVTRPVTKHRINQIIPQDTKAYQQLSGALTLVDKVKKVICLCLDFLQ